MKPKFPKLIVLDGTLKEKAYELVKAEVSLGREVMTDIPLAEASVSRRHCVVRREGDEYVLIDLDSSNGTMVNDLPIKCRVLKHEDRIRIGDSVFLFAWEEDAPDPLMTQVHFDEDDEGFKNDSYETMELRQEEAVYLQPEKVAALPPTERISCDLNALLELSRTINSLNNAEQIQRRTLALLSEAIPVESGAMLLYGGQDGTEEFASVVAWQDKRTYSQSVIVSRTIVRKVLANGAALLMNDVLKREETAESFSLIFSRTRSLLAVPLVVMGQTLGVLYLVTSHRERWFDANDLQLVTAMAGIVGVALQNADRISRLEHENKWLQREITSSHVLIGESPAIREVQDFISRVAPADSSVLLRGEYGTGKALVARALHQHSQRSHRPFIVLNCSALTEALLESELFGHVRGAFTGAINNKLGRLELAEGGTIFLDDIAALSPGLQVRLLRVLEHQEIERLGNPRPIKVNIRLIAATHHDLEAKLQQGTFRKDLYDRLTTLSVTMPPLREHREDIPLLANYFAKRYARECKRVLYGISPEARKCLQSYGWPGNVRELENVIERAVVLGSSSMLSPEDLPDAVLDALPFDALTTNSRFGGFYETLRDTKRRLILDALDKYHGDVNNAARSLGLQLSSLQRLITNLGLQTALKK